MSATDPPVNVRIFRMKDDETVDLMDDDLIEISTYLDGEKLPTGRFTSLASYQIEDTRTQTMNPLPFEDEARKPDTGFSGTRYTLELIFQDLQTTNGVHPDIKKIRDWMRENQISDDFHEGKIGIQNDFERNYNLVPEETAGFKIVDFQLRHALNTPTIKRGTLVMDFSGDPSKIGADVNTATVDQSTDPDITITESSEISGDG